jgi:hypothetical protein
MPGPNSSRTGRQMFGRSRPRGVQPTEKEKQDAIVNYSQRAKNQPSKHVKTAAEKLRRQMEKDDEL